MCSLGTSGFVGFTRVLPAGRGVVGFTRMRPRGCWVHSRPPCRSLGSSKVFIWGSWVHSEGVFGVFRGRWFHSRACLGSLSSLGFTRVRVGVSFGSFGVVGFTGARTVDLSVHPGSFGSLGCVLGVVWFVWGRWVRSGAP